VRGVRGVANDLEVRLIVDRTDADIARDAVHALALCGTVPDGVQVVVHKGHVTLTGKVNWMFQKRDADRAVRHIRGVSGVLNYIDVTAKIGEGDVRRSIVRALHRHADVDARQIAVAVSGETATLTGTVSTWQQREIAERAAADTPSIGRVDNRVTVEPVDGSDEMC